MNDFISTVRQGHMVRVDHTWSGYKAYFRRGDQWVYFAGPYGGCFGCPDKALAAVVDYLAHTTDAMATPAI